MTTHDSVGNGTDHARVERRSGPGGTVRDNHFNGPDDPFLIYAFEEPEPETHSTPDPASRAGDWLHVENYGFLYFDSFAFAKTLRAAVGDLHYTAPKVDYGVRPIHVDLPDVDMSAWIKMARTSALFRRASPDTPGSPWWNRTLDPHTPSRAAQPPGAVPVWVVGTGDDEHVTATALELDPENAFPPSDLMTFGNVHVQIQDPGAASLLRQFLILLTSRGHGLSEAELTRASHVLDDAFPTPGPTPEDALGPLYTAKALATRWGVTRQAIHKRAQLHSLLAVPVSDGSVLFPAFQFTDPDRPRSNEVLPAIKDVTKIITEADEPTMVVASWLTAPDPRLGERSAVDWLRAGEDPETVINLARTDVSRWAV